MANEITKVTDQNGVDHPFKDVAAFPRSEQAVLGAHNINRTDYAADPSASGSIFTVNTDNSVVIDGAVPSGGNITIGLASQCGFVAPFDGQVKLTGGYNADFHVFAYDMTASARPYTDSSKTTRLTSTDNQYGSTPQSFYMEKGHEYGMVIRGMAGKTASNVTIKPLLVVETDSDTTYTAPAMTNRELTEKGLYKKGFLPANTDLDTLMDNGIYHLAGVYAHAIYNDGNMYGVLTVEKGSDENYAYIVQTYTRQGGGIIYVFKRFYIASSGWTNWNSFTGTPITS